MTAQLALQQTKALRAAASGRILFDALAAELSVNRHSNISVLRLWIVMACCCACGAQGPSITERAARIDQELPQLRVDSATVFTFSTEGASIAAHYRASALRRLHATFLGESGGAEETYYFDPDLILVRRGEFQYDRPHGSQIRRAADRVIIFTEEHSSDVLHDSVSTAAGELLTALARADRLKDRRP